ncbi:hypothetical protein QTI33_33240 [Variovorax sp. J22P271]|nr:hypothetical protein [Variovorax sp. J22P271]
MIADWVIARRGPGRASIRQPFENLLAGYSAEHDAYIRKFPSDSIAPRLNPATRTHFKRLSAHARLLPPRYHLDALIAAVPRTGKLWLTGGQARWSGDVAVADVATFWSDDSPQFDLTVIDAPDLLESGLAHAIARLAIHAPRVELFVDAARWQPFITALSIESPSTGGLRLPRLRALGGHPSILNPVTLPSSDLAQAINRALDRWLLTAVNRHVTRYIELGADPGRAVSFIAAADLRQQMSPIWQDWVQRFLDEPALLTRFLGLAICAKDEPIFVGEASALAGPMLLTPLIRACVVALAVATAWQVTAPRGVHPGNLARDANGIERTGHACAAGYIDSEDMALVALRHAWTTEFVLLPMQTVSPGLIAGANTSFGTSDTLLLAQPGIDAKLVLAVDPSFRAAASTSAAALRESLLAIEEEHFARLGAAIERPGDRAT